MKLIGSGGQQLQHPLFIADSTITAGGTAQLVLGRSFSRSFLLLQNLSNGPLWFEFGSARATATLTSGVVTSFTVTNIGFGFSNPPLIRLFGGGNQMNSSYQGLAQPNAPAPQNVCTAVAVMTGSAPNQTLSSITITNAGAGYKVAPYVHIINSDLDPNGCAVPSAGVGLLIPAATAPLIWNGTACPTDSIGVFGVTTGQAFACRWMD